MATEIDHSNLRRIGSVTEHGFATENTPYCQSVNATDQIGVLPNFDRMGVSLLMKPYIGCNHFIGYPGALIILPVCTVIDYRSKSLINRYIKALLPKLSI